MGKWRTWRPAETEQLLALVGQLPMDLVVTHWNRWAARQGIPQRSEASLRRKAFELGVSVVPDGTWVAMGIARRHLGRSQQCLNGWAAAGWVLHRPGALQRASLVRLARRRPALFAGCPPDGLLALLHDPVLVAGLVAAYPSRRSVPRMPQAVRCESTGQVFRSQRAAGRAYYLDGSAIGKALREDRPAAGLRFRLVA